MRRLRGKITRRVREGIIHYAVFSGEKYPFEQYVYCDLKAERNRIYLH